jgi:hypothetical protein
MLLRFYYVGSDDTIVEIPSGGDIPHIGQKVILPDKDEVHIVISTLIDYRKWGNNYPTYVNITVVKERSIA